MRPSRGDGPAGPNTLTPGVERTNTPTQANYCLQPFGFEGALDAFVGLHTGEEGAQVV
ncbi:hypothetical protein GCM10027565_27830 [Bordetella tumulicola]